MPRRASQRLSRFAGPALLLFALAMPFMRSTTTATILDLGILVLTYVMLGWGLNIVVGLAGLLDLGYVAFYAVGAYSYALLAHTFRAGRSGSACRLPASSPPSGASCSASRCCGCAATISPSSRSPSARSSASCCSTGTSFTGGPNGISGIPRPSFFGIPFTAGEGGFAATFGLEFTPTAPHHLSLST